MKKRMVLTGIISKAVLAALLAGVLALSGCSSPTGPDGGDSGSPTGPGAPTSPGSPTDSTYSISLSQTETHTFPAAAPGYDYGYGSQGVTITNTGNQATGALSASLSGTNSGSFILSTTSISSIEAGGTSSFTVFPRTGLAVKTYTATVTVSDGIRISASFNVRFTVTTAPICDISLDQSGIYIFPVAVPGYSAQTAKSVTITNTDNQATGALTASLSGNNPSFFTLSATSLDTIEIGGTRTFTIVPKTGLPVGTYTATVTVSGDNVTSKSFNVRFTVTTTNAATPRIIEQSGSTTYTQNAPATALTIFAISSDGTLSYQWYKNNTPSTTGGTVAGNSASYVPSTANIGTAYYYVVVTNTNNSATEAKTATVTSTVYTVTVNPASVVNATTPSITGQPTGATYTQNAPATALTVMATKSDGGTLSYQWYKNTSNSTTGGTAVGTNSASYPPVTSATGTLYYYVVVTNTNNNATGAETARATSSVATVTVNTLVNAATPSITGQPVSATYTQNATATALTVTATRSDSGTLSYQWYKNTSNSTTGGTAVGANSTSYTPVTSAAGTLYYYVVVTNTNNSVSGAKTATAKSSVAAVVVNVATYSIRGLIKGNDTGANGLSGATVQLKSGGAAQGSAVSTGTDGAYTITGVPNGTYTIEMSRSGYATVTLDIAVSGRNLTGVDTILHLNSNGFSYAFNGDEITITDYTGSATVVNIPSTINGCPVTTIGERAFNGCSGLLFVTIPDSVTTIGNSAFGGCSDLRSVTIGNGVTRIDLGAFNSCTSLTSVTIPSNVTVIQCYAFDNCSNLSTVYVLRAITPLTALGTSLLGNWFRNTSASLVIYVPSSVLDNYKVATNWSTYESRIQGME